MSDQATELRKLVLCSSRGPGIDAGPAPRSIVLTGGKGGLGVTTLAVNLAVAMANQGSRVVLVDANLRRGDVAMLCGVTERGDIADVMNLRRDIHEVLVRGPAGLQLVPGLWAPGTRHDYSSRQHNRLLQQLRSIGRHADLVVVDVGCGIDESVRRFWEMAQRIVMVTSCESYAVMDTYATIKALTQGNISFPIGLLVNQCPDRRAAEDVHRRIDQSTRRFLGLSVESLGWLPCDDAIPDAARNGTPFVLAATRQPAVLALEQLAGRLAQEESSRSRENRAA